VLVVVVVVVTASSCLLFARLLSIIRSFFVVGS
jgi:hypothetical protein